MALGGLFLPASSALAQEASETARKIALERRVKVDEAQELLRLGDLAYESARYADAVEAYAGARDLLVDAPATAELRAAATERFALASTERAREQARLGDLAGAKATLDKALDPAVSPKHPGASQLRSQLDDPARTNPALTPEHTRNVDSVRRLLYTADGAYQLGKFDEAVTHYENVLRIDPTNTAARRGMEQVAAAKSRHHQAAYDHTRGEMLAEVDRGWELTPPPIEETPDLARVNELTPGSGPVSVAAKLKNITIPSLRMEQATLEEALDLIRLRAREFDTLEADPDQRGVNITVNLGDPLAERTREILTHRFNLALNNVPLAEALRYVCEMTRTSFTTDEFSVRIVPLGSTSDTLVVRSYRVPPDFLSSLNASAGTANEANVDIFAERPAEGLLARRLGVQEALAAQNVGFPEGASASLNQATNTLRVINTETNQEIIYQIIQAVTETEPVSIMIRLTMIDVQQNTLEELGFDWLLDTYTFRDGADNLLALSGGTQGNGGDFSNTNLAPGTTATNPITAGNRSGDEAFSVDSIDSLIQESMSGGRQDVFRAPGILNVTGILDDARLQMVVRGLSQKKGVDLLAQPTTITRSGQASSVIIAREMLYPTEYEPPELPNNIGGGTGTTPVTPATPTAFDKADVGITLEVLPVADPGKNYIDVKLSPTFNDFQGFINFGSAIRSQLPATATSPAQSVEVTENRILMPVFSPNRVDTQLSIADGATVVIGGLMQESIETIDDKTPILGSLPGIGRLFQTKGTNPRTRAVIFLVTVEMLDPTGRSYRDR